MFENIKTKLKEILENYNLAESEVEFNFDELPATNLHNIYLIRVSSIEGLGLETDLLTFEIIIYLSFEIYKNNNSQYETIIDETIIPLMKDIYNGVVPSTDITVSDLDLRINNFLQPKIKFKANYL